MKAIDTVLLAKIAHRNMDAVHPDKRRCNCKNKMKGNISDHEPYCKYFRSWTSSWIDAHDELIKEEAR